MCMHVYLSVGKKGGVRKVAVGTYGFLYIQIGIKMDRGVYNLSAEGT